MIAILWLEGLKIDVAVTHRFYVRKTPSPVS